MGSKAMFDGSGTWRATVVTRTPWRAFTSAGGCASVPQPAASTARIGISSRRINLNLLPRRAEAEHLSGGVQGRVERAVGTDRQPDRVGMVEAAGEDVCP